MAAADGDDCMTKQEMPVFCQSEFKRLATTLTRLKGKVDTLTQTVATLKERSRLTHMMAGILGGALAIGGGSCVNLIITLMKAD